MREYQYQLFNEQHQFCANKKTVNKECPRQANKLYYYERAKLKNENHEVKITMWRYPGHGVV